MKNKLLIALMSVSTTRLPAQSTPAPKPLDLLKHRLDTISKGVSADWGVYIKSLDTGEEIAINADTAMDTMSTIKIPLLVDVYRQVDAGQVNPADRIVRTMARQAFRHRSSANPG